MRRRGFSLFVVVLAVSVLAAAQAFAQGGGASTTGSINGKIVDSSGAILPGVTVTVSCSDATASSAFTAAVNPIEIRMFSRFNVLKPGSSKVTV